MNFLNQIKRIFISISIVIDFVDNHFCLSFYQNNKPVPYQEVLKSDWGRLYFSSAKQSVQIHQAVITAAQILPLFTNRNSLKLPKNINISITEKARGLCFKPILNEPLFFYSYSAETGYLYKNACKEVLYLEPGFYLQGTTIWYVENKEICNLLTMEKVG